MSMTDTATFSTHLFQLQAPLHSFKLVHTVNAGSAWSSENLLHLLVTCLACSNKYILKAWIHLVNYTHTHTYIDLHICDLSGGRSRTDLGVGFSLCEFDLEVKHLGGRQLLLLLLQLG